MGFKLNMVAGASRRRKFCRNTELIKPLYGKLSYSMINI